VSIEIPEPRNSGTPEPTALHISLLSAGKDPHYALGLLEALVEEKVRVDFVGNDSMKACPAASNSLVTYLNLRGDQNTAVSIWTKVTRVLGYYAKLLRYAASAKPSIFHILWFNKFEVFDNTFLILYYRLLGKRLVFTAHNVSTASRDGRRSALNEWSLRYLYRHVDHVFVHTGKMKHELMHRFGVSPERISALPFPVNNVTPRCNLNKEEARKKLGLNDADRIMLLFGNIAPYKGVEDCVRALARLRGNGFDSLRLLIVGRVKDCPEYWSRVEGLWKELDVGQKIMPRIEVVPEDEVGCYFRAADVLLLPYRKIYQSGVLFLSYNQGLPVIASDVGELAESVIEGETGFVCRPEDPDDLAEKIATYFDSPLHCELETRRRQIIDYVNREHSWKNVTDEHCEVYRKLIEC